MGVQKCQIHLDRPIEGFKAGAIVSGQVNYLLDKDTDFKAIVLTLKGKGQCAWTVTHNKTTIQYNGRENIFTQIAQLLDSRNAVDGKVTLAEGSYTINFRLPLPTMLPQSFREDSFNFIAYHLKIVFVRAAQMKKNNTFKVEIPMQAHVDIGSDAYTEERNPVTIILTKPVWKLFARDGDVIAKIHLPKSVYLPGEPIQLVYEVNNQTTLTLPGIKTKILQEIKLRADCGIEHLIRKVLCKATPTRGIDCGLQKSIPCEVQIPHGTDPVVQHSRVISTMYFLRITVRLPGMRRNSTFETPIIIGSCFRPSAMQPPLDYLYPEACSSSSGQQPPLPPAYDDVSSHDPPPPSYWEAMRECSDDDDDDAK